MAEQQKPSSAVEGRPAPQPPPPPQTASSSWASGAESSEWKKRPRYPNPPDAANPDPATLREQWRFATRQYARWYSHAWGTAILAGAAFFALGWFVKGSNPLSSRSADDDRPPPDSATSGARTE